MRSIQRQYDPDFVFRKQSHLYNNNDNNNNDIDKNNECDVEQCGLPLPLDSTTACDDGRQRAVRCDRNNDDDVCRWRVLDECIGSPVLSTPPERVTSLIDNANHDRPLVAVVIGGQLARFELESKIAHLLSRDIDVGVDLVLFLVLSHAPPTFNRAEFQRLGAPHLFNDTIGTLFERLTGSIAWPVVAYDYDAKAEQRARLPLPPTNFTRRHNHGQPWHRIALGSVLQFEVLSRALTLVESFERRVLRQRRRFDAILRLRDDALLIDRFDVGARLAQLSMARADVLTPQCARWWGVNDQLYMLRRTCFGVLRRRLEQVAPCMLLHALSV
jgi:hypothetical protein